MIFSNIYPDLELVKNLQAITIYYEKQIRVGDSTLANN